VDTGLQELTEYDWSIKDMTGAYRIAGAFKYDWCLQVYRSIQNMTGAYKNTVA